MICENCGSSTFEVEQNGSYFCTNCGLVTDAEEPISFGESTDIAQKGISTLLNISDAKLKSTFAVNSSERSTKLVSELISQWCYVLILPTVIRDESIYIYSSIVKNKMTQGRRIDELAASCLYIATKLSNPRPLKVIENATLISSKKILKSSKIISKGLKLMIPNTDPWEFIPYIRSILGLSYDIEIKAVELSKKSSISNPRINAGTSIYVATLMNGTPVDTNAVAEAALISTDGLTKAIDKEIHP